MFDFKNTVESIDFWDTGVFFFFVFLAVYQNIFKSQLFETWKHLLQGLL